MAVRKKDLNFYDHFAVEIDSTKSQAATMVLNPGESEGGPENFHAGAEQWLFVFKGRGEAIVDRKKLKLEEGSLIFIPKGAKHQITNTGKKKLRTLNFYVPKAYSMKGNELEAGKAKVVRRPR